MPHGNPGPRPALRSVPGAETPAGGAPSPDPADAPGSPGTTSAPPLPAETAPTGSQVPDLLAALDAGDDAAVWAWVRAHVPEPQSLLLYALLLSVGIAGLVEWPALVLSALGQFIVDRRFGGVEELAAQLRARVDALTA